MRIADPLVALTHAQRQSMNISKSEQRVLHVLAQGGCIRHEKHGRKITAVTCFTHDGAVLGDCTQRVFARLRQRGLIASQNGAPYRISHTGRLTVRAQPDNRS
jgi:uncharacterized protein